MKYRKIKNTASFLTISLTIALLSAVMIGVSSGDGDLDHVSIGDFVWADLNVDGIQDAGELGIPDVIVNLYNGNGILIDTTTTNETGEYLFDNLVPGDYYIEFVLPSGYAFSPQDQGSDDTIDSDANVITGKTIMTTLLIDEDDMTWDAGMYIPCEPASIGDFVWNDINEDGIQDDEEPGIPDVTVELYDCDDVLLATTTTDGDGIYSFIVAPGDYYVKFILPGGMVFSPMNQGADDTVDSNADPDTGKTVLTTLECGENDLTWDAGMYQPHEYCGCSHGFWKNHHQHWQGYMPTQVLNTVFTFPSPELDELADDTLDDALRYNGGDDLVGGAQILLRNAVASLLNAAHPGVDYQLTESEVITQVNDSLASLNRDTMLDLEAIFDIYNNQGGCLCDEENDVRIVRHSGKTHSNREIVEEPPEIISDEEISDEQENEGDDSNAINVDKKLGMLHMKEKKFNQQHGCSGEEQGTDENLIDSDEQENEGDDSNAINVDKKLGMLHMKEKKFNQQHGCSGEE